MPDMILAIDQGTTSSRAIVFDAKLKPVSVGQQEFRQFYPKSGWVEHDPQEIWSSQLATARQVLQQAGLGAEQIASMGITNQRETTVLWHRRTGQPLHNAIVWQDTRTTEFLATLSDASVFWSEAKKQGAFSSYGSMNPGVSVKITTSNDYEEKVVTKASLSNMIRELPKVLLSIQKMKHWNISHALFLENSEIFDVKSIINNNVGLKDSKMKKELDISSCIVVSF